MNVMLLRAEVKPEHVEDVRTALQTMFAAIEAAQPNGVQYASCQVQGAATFVILLALERPDHNPLPTVPEFRAFQEGLRGWLAEPPVPEQLWVVGSYNLF